MTLIAEPESSANDLSDADVASDSAEVTDASEPPAGYSDSAGEASDSSLPAGATPLIFAKAKTGATGRLQLEDLEHVFYISQILRNTDLEPFFHRVMQNLQKPDADPTEAVISSVCGDDADSQQQELVAGILRRSATLFLEANDLPETKHLLASISLLCPGPQDARLFVAFTPYDVAKGACLFD